jgi:hypothetical protein
VWAGARGRPVPRNRRSGRLCSAGGAPGLFQRQTGSQLGRAFLVHSSLLFLFLDDREDFTYSRGIYLEWKTKCKFASLSVTFDYLPLVAARFWTTNLGYELFEPSTTKDVNSLVTKTAAATIPICTLLLLPLLHRCFLMVPPSFFTGDLEGAAPVDQNVWTSEKNRPCKSIYTSGSCNETACRNIQFTPAVFLTQPPV